MSKDSSLYLALDQGGHSSRAFVFNTTGDIVARAQVPIATQVFRASVGEGESEQQRIEHSAEELATSLTTCCQQIVDVLGDESARIVSAGLATQRSSIVCWQRSTGTALTPVLSWQDRRAADRINAHIDKSELVEELTGLVMSPHYGASKLRWCLDHVQSVRDAAEADDLTIGPLASYLIRALTGELPDVCDPANASRTLLWNRHTKNWSTRLCELFGVDLTLLPHSVPTRHNFGHVSVGPYSVPLHLVTGDQSAAIYAFGQAQPSTAFINLGTGAFMQCPIGQQTADVDGLLNSVVYQDAARLEYVLEGTVNGAGRALTWWSEQHDIDSKTLVSEALSRLQTNREFAASVPVFLNGISGLGSPYWRSHFTSRFMHANPNSQESIEPGAHAGAIAILDSIAFLLHANLTCASTSSLTLERLVLTGGLASVDYLCRALADVCGLTTVRSTLREATAQGVGYLISQSDEWPGTGKLTSFDACNNKHLANRHTAWQSLMESALSRAD